MCKAEHVNKELDDPAKEISRQPVEGTIWLPLALCKMQGERHKLRGDLLSREEQGFEEPQPLERANNFKTKKFLKSKGQIQGTVMETWPKVEAEGMTINSLL